MSDDLTIVRTALDRLKQAGTARIRLQLSYSWAEARVESGESPDSDEQGGDAQPEGERVAGDPSAEADQDPAADESGTADRGSDAASGPTAGAQPEPPLDELERLVRAGLAAAGRSAAAIGKRVARAAFAPAGRQFRQVTTGVLDLAGARVTLNGPYARLQEGRLEWAGRPGTARRGPGRPISTDSPLWLLGALAGITTVKEHSRVEGLTRFDVEVNLAAASAAYPDGLPSPGADRYEDLLALPLTIWIDAAGDLRRVRFVDPPVTCDLYLSDLGLDLSGLDWTVLPTGPNRPFRGGA